MTKKSSDSDYIFTLSRIESSTVLSKEEKIRKLKYIRKEMVNKEVNVSYIDTIIKYIDSQYYDDFSLSSNYCGTSTLVETDEYKRNKKN